MKNLLTSNLSTFWHRVCAHCSFPTGIVTIAAGRSQTCPLGPRLYDILSKWLFSYHRFSRSSDYKIEKICITLNLLIPVTHRKCVAEDGKKICTETKTLKRIVAIPPVPRH